MLPEGYRIERQLRLIAVAKPGSRIPLTVPIFANQRLVSKMSMEAFAFNNETSPFFQDENKKGNIYFVFADHFGICLPFIFYSSVFLQF